MKPAHTPIRLSVVIPVYNEAKSIATVIDRVRAVDLSIELINGEIINMTPIGPRHNAAVNRANRALVGAAGTQAIVQVQGSIRLDLSSEPQPDLVLLRREPDFYASRLPGPA